MRMADKRIDRPKCLQVEPPSSETNTLSDAKLATPAKIRGVASPLEPEVESKVTHARPMMSLLYPEVSVGSGT